MASTTRMFNRSDSRAVRPGRVALAAFLMVVAAACGSDENAGRTPGTGTDNTRSAALTGGRATADGPLGQDCDATFEDPDRAQAELSGDGAGSVGAGGVVCLGGSGFSGVDLVVSRGGVAGSPVRVVGGGVRVRSVSVAASDVVIEGFEVVGGEGIDVVGRRVTVRSNVVRDARLDAITCSDCVDSLIESNTVERADGTGIWASGSGITVRGNRVSGSVRILANDADGIRFFGSGHLITGNTISDIKDDGYASDPPHTDCFQTYDNGGKLATTNVVISGNTCTNVDHQCLIATAEESSEAGDVGRSRDLRFVDNTCDVGGSQAVLVQWMPSTRIERNRISGPALDRGIYLGDGSVDSRVVDNVISGAISAVEVDSSSEPGTVVR